MERLCALTREVKPVDELIRFVAAPDGAIVPDIKRRLPGRGVWVTATPRGDRRGGQAQCLRAQPETRGARRARTSAPRSSASSEAPHSMRSAIVHKAGRVAIGFGRTEAALGGATPVAAILQASDGSADGARKIAAAAARRQTAENAGEIPVIAAFTSAQLDLALGRSNVVHAALLAGPASNGFLARCQSLERFRRSIRADGARDSASVYVTCRQVQDWM